MAQGNPAALPSPDLVGNDFVQQYYRALPVAPGEVHNFYRDSSCLARPGADGAMTTVTTMQGNNEMILSSDKICEVEILTADSQYSDRNGVIVFVTGFLKGEDTIKRKFAQTFFLAQDSGFFVRNDIFRYVDDHESAITDKCDQESNLVADDSTNVEVHAADPIHDAETTQVIDDSAENHKSPQEKNISNGDKTKHQLSNGETLVAEKELEIADLESNSAPNDVVQIGEKTSPVVKLEAPKKSYASMVNALKENPAPFQVKYMPQPSKPVCPAPTPEATAAAPAPAPSSNDSERNNDHSAKGYSIFIRNLPSDVTAEQLEAIFKKFGSIKPRGIQVRGFKDQQSCFGFVEFDLSSSMTSAIKASPIVIGDRNVTVEMKRRDNNSGGFRNDNFRPRGGYGGRDNGRNEFENQGDFSGRGRGRGNSNGNSYSKDRGVYQNGGAAPQAAKV